MFLRYHEHEVEEDVPDCIDDEEVKCVDETVGYTTEQKCSRWPIKRCSLGRQTVKKFTPETTCEKLPFELCGPSACPVEPGPEECQDKEETVSQQQHNTTTGNFFNTLTVVLSNFVL